MIWLRANLFSSWGNGALTLVTAAVVATISIPALEWALLHAHWDGASRAACAEHGACWVFVKARIGQFIYGFYPEP